MPKHRYAANIAAATSAAPIAPLLAVITRPKITTATAMPHVISQTNPRESELRFLYLSINKAIAANAANIANEPAELLVVKKPLISFEYKRCSNWKCFKLLGIMRCCARTASESRS
ncbi:hypothetical protein ES703_74726 [subsurface metagenome]